MLGPTSPRLKRNRPMANRNPSPSTRFKSGDDWSGNRSGRPPGKSLTGRLRDMLELTTWKGEPLPEGKTVADLLAEVMVKKALGGNLKFFVELLNRTDGKVRHFAEPAAPAQIVVCYADDGVAEV